MDDLTLSRLKANYLPSLTVFTLFSVIESRPVPGLWSVDTYRFGAVTSVIAFLGEIWPLYVSINSVYFFQLWARFLPDHVPFSSVPFM